MSKQTMIAIAAGAVSAAIFAAPFSNPAFGLMLVNYFTQLPLFLVGLSLGVTAAAVAVAAAAVLVAVVLGISGALPFLFAFGVPAFVVVRQSLSRRTAPDGSVEWYPPGRVLTILAGYGATVFVAVLLVTAAYQGSLQELTRVWLVELLAQIAPMLPVEEHAARAEQMSSLIPAIVVTSWQLMVVINALLAQGTLVRSNRNLRPSTRFAQMELPNGLAAAAGLSLALWFAGSDTLGFAGKTLTIIFAAPYFLQGLAVIHELTRGWSARRFALAAFYILLLFVMGWLSFATLAALGFVEQWTKLRQRFAGLESEEKKNPWK